MTVSSAPYHENESYIGTYEYALSLSLFLFYSPTPISNKHLHVDKKQTSQYTEHDSLWSSSSDFLNIYTCN